MKFSQKKKKLFIAALQQEISISFFNIKPKTIYFGGGTPSLLLPEEIQKIIELFPQTFLEEITLEINPGTIDEQYVKKLVHTKVNRISLGTQSFVDRELKLLGRIHDSRQNVNTFQMLKEHGFSNISLDLIYGLPGQTKSEVRFSLEKLLKLSPQHVSAYCLSLDKNVPLFSQKKNIPNDTMLEEFYHLICQTLINAGFQHYELSNFASLGLVSKHNMAYWNDKFYLGFGPAAAGYFQKEKIYYRYENKANVDSYIKKDFQEQREILKTRMREKEFIFLNLRKIEGLSLKEYEKKFKTDFKQKYSKEIKKMEDFLVIEEDKIKFDKKGYFISDEIFSEFM